MSIAAILRHHAVDEGLVTGGQSSEAQLAALAFPGNLIHKPYRLAPMSFLTLHAPALDDLDELLAFELDNRAFFERWINARPADYYTREGVALAIEGARRDAAADAAHQYLVREDGQLVARVNLTQIRRPHYQSAMLGYRVGEAHNGRGIAKAAVGLALQQAFGALALWRVEATVRPEHGGSMRVLEANGFALFGRARRCFLLGGAWHDLLHYECHAEPAPCPA